MIEPAALIDAAQALINTVPRPTEEAIRRSISTSYYAVFHLVIRSGADRLFGSNRRTEAGYILLYRGYSHTRLKEVFKSLNVPSFPPKLQLQLRRTSASQPMRDFASVFVDLQERRHSADYDAQANFVISDAQDAVDSARVAVGRIRRIQKSEIAEAFALMLLNNRNT